MMHATNPLEKDVTNLFENEEPHVNDMREFFAESVCEMLDNGINPMEHYEAALHIFDKWYRDLHETIQENSAKHALTNTTNHPEEAEKTTGTMYQDTHRNIDDKRREETHDED